AVLAGIVLALFPLSRGGPASPRAIPEFPPSPAPEQPALIWWWGLAALVLIGLVGAAAPEVRHDALTAHLPIAREFAARGAIVEMRQNAASYFQHNADLLYAMANVLLPGEAVPKFLHVFSGVAASLLVYDVGARMWNPRVGLAAAAVVAGTPLVWWVGGSAYTDLWTMLFGIGMLAGLVLYSRRPGAGRALLVGLMAGAAVGVKITAVVVVAPLVAVFLLRVARTRSAERPWLALTAFLVGVAATGAFWYVRAWLLTGNPVFPLLGGIFRGPYGGSGTTGSVAAIFGMGSTPWDFLLLPWRVTRFPGRFVEDGNIGIVYLTLVPAAVLAVARRQVPRFVAGVLAAAGLIWFLTAQYLRYFLPALPLAALIGAAGVFARSAAAPSPLVSALILTLVLSLGAGTWVAPGAAYFPYPVVARTMTRTAYLDRYLSGFTLAAYARSLPPSARIYSVGEDKAFLYGQFFVPASWYGRIGYGGLAGAVRTARTGAKIQTILTQAGFTHLIVYVPIAAGWGGPGSWIAREALWEEGPRLEDGADEYYLFDLRHPDGPRRRGPEVSVDLKTVTAAGFSSGQMPVQPGVLYALDARVRSGSPGAKARLAVQWIGEGGRELGPPTWREVESGSTWTRRALARSAPSGARHALVHLAPVGDGVQFDALRFYELR
ncbi:MAG: glycosyltransferase family 39 protein, partial [Armatimonadetes bacterium]|nr:glycosyltransferase family 39 protein [Armatimonadota bacterium]